LHERLRQELITEGNCYPREALIELMRFCQRHKLHLISDEIYALSVFENPDFPNAAPFASALSLDTTDVIDSDLVHVIYGLSKDFGVAGLKVGCLISRNEELKKATTAVQRFCALSGPSVVIATQMLENREWTRSIINLSRKRLAEAYAFITGSLREMGVRYLEGGNAGFFVWVDLTQWLPPEGMKSEGATREQMLAQKFLDHGVHLQPGEEHGRKGWFRVVFTALEKVALDEGLRRIEQTLRDVSW
jgi:1-aminocyclopropane-1-carboxylate synthase